MRKWVTGTGLILGLAFLVIVAFVALAALPDGQLHVWFLDVGQGDAVLIQTPDGRQVLVDGGPSPSALLGQLGEVLPFWDRSLDVVVLTHPDADHVSGLIPLFERYDVATVVDSVMPGENGAEGWLAAVNSDRAARQVASRGMRMAAGPVVLTVLNPADGNVAADDGNNGSLVLRLDYGQSSALLTGDAEDDAELAMLAAGVPLRADVLKVGHHGSDASTSPAFLATVQPSVAVISVGAENRFGHPAPELLERLRGVEVLRTDEAGRVELVSDGKGWAVGPER